MAKGTLIGDLSPEAQHTALEGFAKFYLAKYRNEGLDVIAQIDEKGHIADINQWLLDNRNFDTAELLAGLVSARGTNLTELLTTLKAPFNSNGIPATPWDDWFAASEAKIPQGR